MRRDPDALFATRAKSRIIPFDFVLQELADVGPWTRPMFGSTAVYVDEKIVFALRDGKPEGDNGVWVATTREQHASLRKELPSLRSIAVLGIATAYTRFRLAAAGAIGRVGGETCHRSSAADRAEPG
jgi:hypothetical protein